MGGVVVAEHEERRGGGVTYQRGQAFQGGPVGQSGLDRIETRSLQAGNQFGVERRRAHVAMVPVPPVATVGNGFGNATAIDGNSDAGQLPTADLDLNAAVSLALARCGISDKEAAALMGMSPAQWSRQKNGVDGHHIQLDRLKLLPEAFHVEFNRIYSALVGVNVAHARIANLLRARVIELLGEVNTLADQLEALAS